MTTLYKQLFICYRMGYLLLLLHEYFPTFMLNYLRDVALIPLRFKMEAWDETAIRV